MTHRDPNPDPPMLLCCTRCGHLMPVPEEIRLLAESLAAEILFDVAQGRRSAEGLRGAVRRLDGTRRSG